MRSRGRRRPRRGSSSTRRPGRTATTVRFSFGGGNPSDGSGAIPTSGSGAWQVGLPGATRATPAGTRSSTFNISIPASTPAGTYSGVVLATTAYGQVLRIPVFASVALHDTSTAAGNVPGPQARIASGHDVFAKDDTVWPSAVGTPGTGSNADWLVYPVNLAGGLSSARFSVWDADRGDETYDLYVYDAAFDLIAHTHPFVTDGVTDVAANDARGPTTQASPGVLTLSTPAGGRLLCRRQPGEGRRHVIGRRRIVRADARRGQGRSLSTVAAADATATVTSWRAGHPDVAARPGQTLRGSPVTS